MNILKPYEENGQNSPIMYNMSSYNVSTVKVVIVICTEAVKQCSICAKYMNSKNNIFFCAKGLS